MAKAIARPSLVLVPRPSSSTMTLSRSVIMFGIYTIGTNKLRRSTLRRMKAISLISAAKVETLVSMLSSMPSLAKSWFSIGNDAYVAGTLNIVSRTELTRSITGSSY